MDINWDYVWYRFWMTVGKGGIVTAYLTFCFLYGMYGKRS